MQLCDKSNDRQIVRQMYNYDDAMSADDECVVLYSGNVVVIVADDDVLVDKEKEKEEDCGCYVDIDAYSLIDINFL